MFNIATCAFSHPHLTHNDSRKNNSDDKSSVLDNLHKILKEERDHGLDGKTILKECLDIINNPYVITQTCEDIPDEYKAAVLGLVTNMSEDMNELEKAEAFNSQSLISEFDNWQSQFPEELWRLDYERKYYRTYLGLSIDNSIAKGVDKTFLIGKFFGRKKYARQVFEPNQEIYFATKY